MSITRSAVAAVLTAGALVGTAVFAAQPAAADSNSCTKASVGGNCITVSGDGTLVRSVRATFQAKEALECKADFEVAYTKQGQRLTAKGMADKCSEGFNGGLNKVSRTFKLDVHADNGSNVCTRTIASFTGHEWTNWACQTIKR